jgi:hypothetical protein
MQPLVLDIAAAIIIAAAVVGLFRLGATEVKSGFQRDGRKWRGIFGITLMIVAAAIALWIVFGH